MSTVTLDDMTLATSVVETVVSIAADEVKGIASIGSYSTKGLRRRRVGLVENGTWAPVAARKMAEMLGEMTDMTVVGDPVTIRSRLSDNSLRALRDLATLFDS